VEQNQGEGHQEVEQGRGQSEGEVEGVRDPRNIYWVY
jgi:hypothetical protein